MAKPEGDDPEVDSMLKENRDGAVASFLLLSS